MTIHEFGQSRDEVVVLVHPSVVMWDYFEYVIPLMQEHYHLIVPALSGYDTESSSDFTSVEQISEELAALKPKLLEAELTRAMGGNRK